MSDAVRGILDGHLSALARAGARGALPGGGRARSVSRGVAADGPEHAYAARGLVVRLLAAYREVEDLVQIGAYAHGTDPETDTAIEMHPVINELLAQRADEEADFAKARDMLVKLALQSGEMVQQRRQIAQSQSGHQQRQSAQ